MRATRNQKVDMYHNMDNMMMVQDSTSDAVNICDVNQNDLNTVRKQSRGIVSSSNQRRRKIVSGCTSKNRFDDSMKRQYLMSLQKHVKLIETTDKLVHETIE